MIDKFDKSYVMDRVDYYCKIDSFGKLPAITPTIDDFHKNPSWSFYYIDLWEHLKYFPIAYQFAYLRGDITQVPDHPTLVKSRPITGKNENSVIMKLNKIRHYFYVNDRKPFLTKKNMLVWRGSIHNQARRDFVKKFSNHQLCNVGDTADPAHDSKTNLEKGRGYLSIDEHLQYKFILSLEGNDVATNLKWIMSSNSLCFAPKHKYETWFMEGRLIPDYHYVLIKDDYSDLIEKICYYTEHPNEAMEIIKHANEYVEPFKNEKMEELISLLVLQKYFKHTNGQIE